MSVHGYARLDALVRRHPGWGGVARYDQALTRLAEAARRTPPNAPPDMDLVGLPPAPGALLSAPALALAGESLRLEAIQRVQVSRLRDRQEGNRRRQITLESQAWERQAAAQYARTVEEAQAAYTRRLSLLGVDSDARRLNLTLQIGALQKIVSGWNASTPPTPRLNAARTELEEKKAALALLDQGRQKSLAQARSVRDTALQAALQTRTAFVSGLAGAEETRLRSQDDLQAATLQGRLVAQRQALLAEERSLSAPPVSPAGGLGSQRLPAGPVPATAAPGAGHSFRLAKAQLEAERARWLSFLYSDTQAAALDAAARQHWVVTFGRAAPGGRDLTAALAQALTTRVWKT